MDDETQLLAAARAGDPDAWELLYRRAYPGLIAYARRRLAGAERAEDAVSETMTRAMDLIDAYRPTGRGLQAWLFGIARNVVLETARADGRQVAVDPAGLTAATEADTAWPGAGARRGDPVAVVLRSEQRRRLATAFGRLSRADQEVLELRVLGDLDAEQAGQVLGRRAGAVRTAQSRALQRLRVAFESVTR